MNPFTTAKQEQRPGYTIIDKRGAEPLRLLCRVCGSSVEHSKDYNKPTMACINWLKDQINNPHAQFDRSKIKA